MWQNGLSHLVFFTALGCGIAGGVFFAFSTFVMGALRRLRPAEGIAAMQAINVEAPTPWFMTALFGTALASAVLGLTALPSLAERAAVLRLLGSTVYLVGIVLTIAVHVPKNNALAEVDPSGANAAAVWTNYLTSWTAWNHVRTITCVSASALLMSAVRLAD